MIKIVTWNDTISLLEPMKTLIQNRFNYLFKTYSEGSLLNQFSLVDYGEILIAESFSDIDSKVFEDVSVVRTDSTSIYIATWVKNNDVCCDVIIPQSILSPKQIELLEKEL